MTGAPRPEPALPPGAELVRTTPEFTETTVPAGLLRAHRVAAGTWGRLVVREGAIAFAFDDADGERVIGAGEHQVIPPEREHHVRVIGPVRFAVEFHVPYAGSDPGRNASRRH